MTWGKRSRGAGTCKHRPARNCPTRRDPYGRMSRPEKSVQALEKAQNGLGHDRPGPVGSRGLPPSPATGSATRPGAASPQSRRLGSRSRAELKMAPQAVENAQNGLGNGVAGTRARPTLPTDRPRRTAELPCGRPAMTRPGSRSEAETPPASLGRAVAPKPPSGGSCGDLQMAPHLLENTRNRLENGRPRELDPGITMRLLSWRPGLAAAPASKASCKRLKTFKSRAVERSAAGNARTAAVRRRAMTDGPTPASGPTLPLSKSKARAGYSERLALPEIDC